ncbi:aspartyl protease family protein [Gramella sp. MAR_2010_147]|uniref:aspartyl protease family protein n=1 Tax=Gramella sp. MAR_2010_147 TaxID=1250205 RepID=UPI0015606255|nr:aspartyl protease family protein [Gramella sp. MAR_2010_147]
MFFTNVFAQDDFIIEDEKGKFKQRFELANDLVIVPVEINGRELSFLLDTGVNSTILFSLTETDTTLLNNPKVVYLKGLGVGKPLRALKSNHNTVKIGQAVNEDHSVYIIEGGIINISNRIGVSVNGILGYDFFKNFVIEFNYKRKLMKVYNNEVYNYRNCSRCIDLPLKFYKDKPYIEANVELNNGVSVKVDLLVDSGSSDALWLFENSALNLHIPDKSFEDFLGFGITGSVYGFRSRISSLSLKKYDLDEITVSFPDSLFISAANSFEERDGSVGAQVLKRFNSVVDYSKKNLRLKPNGNFKDPFEYNMSGIVVQYNGYRIVKSGDTSTSDFQIERDSNGITNAYTTSRNVFYSLESRYEVAEIRPESPAALAGLMIGDEIIKLNGRPVYKFNIHKIIQVLSSKEGKKIKLEIMRNGKLVEVEFRLERIL